MYRLTDEEKLNENARVNRNRFKLFKWIFCLSKWSIVILVNEKEEICGR